MLVNATKLIDSTKCHSMLAALSDAISTRSTAACSVASVE